jgi:hypothetical protein
MMADCVFSLEDRLQKCCSTGHQLQILVIWPVYCVRAAKLVFYKLPYKREYKATTYFSKEKIRKRKFSLAKLHMPSFFWGGGARLNMSSSSEGC